MIADFKFSPLIEKIPSAWLHKSTGGLMLASFVATFILLLSFLGSVSYSSYQSSTFENTRLKHAGLLKTQKLLSKHQTYLERNNALYAQFKKHQFNTTMSEANLIAELGLIKSGFANVDLTYHLNTNSPVRGHPNMACQSVTLQLSITKDSDFFEIVDLLANFKGLVVIKSLKLHKINTVDKGMLYALAKGEPTYFFEGEITFDWVYRSQ